MANLAFINATSVRLMYKPSNLIFCRPQLVTWKIGIVNVVSVHRFIVQGRNTIKKES
jgi:hypothetical protein